MVLFEVLKFNLLGKFITPNDKLEIYLIRKYKGKIFCDCDESIFYGIPCRHELSLCIILFKDPMILFFKKRWEIKYFNFEEVKYKDDKKEDLNVSFNSLI